jgi:general secretion pathway protein M
MTLDSALRNRAAAVLILLLLVVALWLGPVTAYLDYLDDGAARIDAKTELLARYRALAAAPAAMPAVDDRLPLFPPVPDTQAVALLQETVKGAAAAANVQVQGLQVLQSEKLSGAVRIGLRIRGAADIASLARLLYAIETARPLLYPDDLQIQAPPAPKSDAPVLLQFQVDVSGFTPAAPT